MTFRAALIAAPAAILLAQTSSFHVATRLIQVSVVATDRHGDPVTGLKKDDFAVFDQGRQQKIAFFSEQAGRARPAAASTKKSALVFSNRPDEKAGESYVSATVILFDRLNTRFEESAYARERLAKFLTGVRPDDRIALYGLASKLVVLHDFTQDASALLRALEQYKPIEPNETRATMFKETNSIHEVIDWFENRTNQRESDTLMTGRVQATAAALEAIANHLAGLPGRKNLVWVSAAFPISIGYFQRRIRGTRPEKENFDAEAEAAARALSAANVAIYPVDAHVLATLGGIYDSSKAPQSGVMKLQSSVPLPEITTTEETGTMTKLADETGGRVFANTNDIGGAVRSAIDDSAFTYTIGYYPDHDQWDGRFREIKVKVKQPGVEVRNRSGYLAVGEAAPRTPITVDAVIRRPLESGELGLSIEPERVAGRQLKLHIRMDASTIRFEEKDGRWEGQIEVLSVQLGPDGRDVSGHGQMLNLRLSPETYKDLPRNGLKIVSMETIDEKAVQFRFAARDPATGAAGSLYIPVQALVNR